MLHSGKEQFLHYVKGVQYIIMPYNVNHPYAK